MKIGMTLSRADIDAPLADHFGKAKWLLVYEAPVRCELVRNEGLNGAYVAEVLARRGCTDVVVRHLGPGAYAHVKAAGMLVWRGDEARTARELAEALKRGELAPLAESDVGRAEGAGRGPHRHAHGDRS